MVAKVFGFVAQIAPWAVVASLGYAAAFIHPTVEPLPLPQPLTEPRDIFYDVASANGERFWFVGNAGTVLEGTREPEGWERHAMPEPINLQGVAVTPENTVVAVGNEGAVFIRRAGGEEWTSQRLPVSERAGKMVDAAWLNGALWVVGEMGAIFRSDDGGRNWQSLGLDKDIGLNDIETDADGTLWITAEFGDLIHSTDNGESWKTRNFGSESLRSVAFAGDGTGVVVGNNGAMLHRSGADSGWQSLESVTSEHLYDVGFDGERWLAVGNSGAVIASGNGEDWEKLRPEGFGSGYHTRLNTTERGTVIAGQTIGLLRASTWNTWPVEEN
ncbi:WD40/YVTN/BNR-like repeat-containing protein [Vreelandella utahensis]|uniref:WD40/YVTN/BNR-like repeat-containing protein n=1 Tax=Vreelandella halophila TaxID=86177 RepID=UPI0009852524|nr:YCF48-related protein [Halomonas utahensis]